MGFKEKWETEIRILRQIFCSLIWNPQTLFTHKSVWCDYRSETTGGKGNRQEREGKEVEGGDMSNIINAQYTVVKHFKFKINVF